jgi:flagellar export protein FliJ
MKKFVFSLEKVLGYKQQLLGMLKNELSALQARRFEILGQIEQANMEFASTNQALIVKMKEGMTRREIASYKNFLAAVNRRIVSLTENLQVVERQITAKQQEIIKMNSDISGLERIKDHQLAAYRYEAQKEQELFIEEFVSHTHIKAG